MTTSTSATASGIAGLHSSPMPVPVAGAAGTANPDLAGTEVNAGLSANLVASNFATGGDPSERVRPASPTRASAVGAGAASRDLQTPPSSPRLAAQAAPRSPRLAAQTGPASPRLAAQSGPASPRLGARPDPSERARDSSPRNARRAAAKGKTSLSKSGRDGSESSNSLSVESSSHFSLGGFFRSKTPPPDARNAANELSIKRATLSAMADPSCTIEWILAQPTGREILDKLMTAQHAEENLHFLDALLSMQAAIENPHLTPARKNEICDPYFDTFCGPNSLNISGALSAALLAARESHGSGSTAVLELLGDTKGILIDLIKTNFLKSVHAAAQARLEAMDEPPPEKQGLFARLSIKGRPSAEHKGQRPVQSSSVKAAVTNSTMSAAQLDAWTSRWDTPAVIKSTPANDTGHTAGLEPVNSGSSSYEFTPGSSSSVVGSGSTPGTYLAQLGENPAQARDDFVQSCNDFLKAENNPEEQMRILVSEIEPSLQLSLVTFNHHNRELLMTQAALWIDEHRVALSQDELATAVTFARDYLGS